jgi:hypothetical protein
MDDHGWVAISKVADFNRVCLLAYFAFSEIIFFSFYLLKIGSVIAWLICS